METKRYTYLRRLNSLSGWIRGSPIVVCWISEGDVSGTPLPATRHPVPLFDLILLKIVCQAIRTVHLMSGHLRLEPRLSV